MKLIVDEMPKNKKDCIFCGQFNVCNIGKDCELDGDSCPYLKPITEYHAEEVLRDHGNGIRTVRSLDIV